MIITRETQERIIGDYIERKNYMVGTTQLMYFQEGVIAALELIDKMLKDENQRV